MDRADLAKMVALDCQISVASALSMIEAWADMLDSELLAGNKMIFSGFGTFSVSTWQSSLRINPRTGVRIVSPAFIRWKFRPSKSFMEAVN